MVAPIFNGEIMFDAIPRYQSRTTSEREWEFTDLWSLLHPDWHKHAACRGLTDVFYPHQHEGATQAKQICASCPVRANCKEQWESVPGTQAHHGIWFGTSDRERRRLRANRAGRPLKCGTRTSYQRGCKCTECREAANLYDLERRRRKREAS